MGEGFFLQDTGVIDQEFGREIVGPVQDKIVLPDDLPDIFRCDVFIVGMNRDLRIDGQHGISGGFHLWPAYVRRRVDDLALQVGQVDNIRIRYADRSHACRGQIESRGCAQSSCSDDQDLCLQ